VLLGVAVTVIRYGQAVGGAVVVEITVLFDGQTELLGDAVTVIW